MRRLFQCFIVVSLVLAVGGHWAVLQSVAWVSMAFNYSKDASLMVALEKTFSGEHPCRLCKAVDEGKKAEQKQAVLKVETRLEFLELKSAVTLYPPVVCERVSRVYAGFIVRPNSPPTPPPRLV